MMGIRMNRMIVRRVLCDTFGPKDVNGDSVNDIIPGLLLKRPWSVDVWVRKMQSGVAILRMDDPNF